MPEIRKILYVHGMGGGGDSRIPSILRERLNAEYAFQVICRTYDFDPEIAQRQLAGWAQEVHPDLVIGESMGVVHAIALRGYPHIFVSPSLNAPFFFRVMAGLARIPGMTRFFDWRYRPKEGDRQRLHFSPGVLRKWLKVRAVALQNTTRNGSEDYFHAFFGSRDHYKR